MTADALDLAITEALATAARDTSAQWDDPHTT